MATPEPLDVGPIVGGHLPATALDRARAQDILTRAHQLGLLTADELLRRTTVAAAADTIDDLVPLTRGLDSPPVAGTAVPASQPLPAVIRDGANPDVDRLIGVFGGSSRSGQWRVRERTHALCVMGGHTLDLREATFDANEVTINVQAFMGGVEIKVPAGVRVVSEIACFMGGVEVKDVVVDPAGPLVRLTGFCFMGGVEVKGPSKGLKHAIRSVLEGDRA